jgi:predicted HTH transcriptional regulator
MWPNNALQREELLRNLIDLNLETSKIDFKRNFEFDTKEKTAELLKDISAIANSDDDEYGGYGFIVFGVQEGKVTHDVPLLSIGKKDNTSAAMRQKLREYIWPEPKFDVLSFDEPGIGSWGAIVIPPSNIQPHFFIKEFKNDKIVIRKGDWFVRKGDTTCFAEPEDYTRVLEKKIRSAVEPLKQEVRLLQERLVRLETLSEMQSEPPKLDVSLNNSKKKTMTLRDCLKTKQLMKKSGKLTG